MNDKKTIIELEKDIAYVQKSLDVAYAKIATICDYDVARDVPLSNIISDVACNLNRKEMKKLRGFISEILDAK